MRSDERAVAVDRADAVGVAIERESGVVIAFANGVAQRLHVRLDRLRIHAAEKRVARAANFGGFDSVTLEKFAQQAAARAVHRVDHEAEFRSAQTVPIHEADRAHRDKACARRANEADPFAAASAGTPSRSTFSSSASTCATIAGEAELP